MAKEPGRVKKRERKNITSGVAHVNASFNNTLVTITDAQGNAISWSQLKIGRQRRARPGRNSTGSTRLFAEGRTYRRDWEIVNDWITALGRFFPLLFPFRFWGRQTA